MDTDISWSMILEITSLAVSHFKGATSQEDDRLRKIKIMLVAGEIHRDVIIGNGCSVLSLSVFFVAENA